MISPFAMLGTPDILICVAIVVILFGGSKLSQLGKGLGDGIREFRTSMEPTNTNPTESAKPQAPEATPETRTIPTPSV